MNENHFRYISERTVEAHRESFYHYHYRAMHNHLFDTIERTSNAFIPVACANYYDWNECKNALLIVWLQLNDRLGHRMTLVSDGWDKWNKYYVWRGTDCISVKSSNACIKRWRSTDFIIIVIMCECLCVCVCSSYVLFIYGTATNVLLLSQMHWIENRIIAVLLNRFIREYMKTEWRMQIVNIEVYLEKNWFQQWVVLIIGKSNELNC